ncbi:MAG: NAD(P)-dependent alcohol dehydrogenase [Candidatus Zixiibacteriota bacterium]
MRQYTLDSFGIDNLRMRESETPEPGPGEVRVAIKALSLNYKDLMIVEGTYNPRLALPVVPIADGAGVVSAIGDGVQSVETGQPVVIHPMVDWVDGPFRFKYHKRIVGYSLPGVASEHVVLPERAVLPVPDGFDLTDAATLPTAGLTAWNCLVEHGAIKPGQTILTLGTGGVSMFALQLGKALGATVIITSSSDEKLAKARALGADHTINYKTDARWDKTVLDLTAGEGADLTLETSGAGSFEQSTRATKANGTVAFLGSIEGLKSEIDLRFVMMKRLTVHGIFVGSRNDFAAFTSFLSKHPIKPVIDRAFQFEQVPDALRRMKSAEHIGKIVVTM